MATTSGPNIITSNLVIAYDAADQQSYPGSGSTWFDVGGSNASLTLNTTSFNSSDSTIVFNGSANATASNVNCNLGGDFTFEFWIYKTAHSGTLLEHNLYTNGILIRPWNSDDLYINGTGYGNLQVPLNQWSHLVVTRIGTSMVSYTNTTQILSATVSGTVCTASNHSLRIGSSLHTSGQNFTGRVSSCKILNGKGLSSSEVLFNYNNFKSRYGI
jgi:hypothetical protein